MGVIVRTTALRVYRVLFARTRMAPWNRLLFDMSARALGILNYETGRASGEDWLLSQIARAFSDLLVLDVGANIGDYSMSVKRIAPGSKVYGFEPHPATYERLRIAAGQWEFEALNVGLSDHVGTLQLHDYEGHPEGSAHASMHEEVIAELHQSVPQAHRVTVTTVDRFLEDRSISGVNLLKIDTEGHEYQVLVGAREALGRGEFDVIQFEFNEMNVVTRRFLRDFRMLLTGYDLYRLLPSGLLLLDVNEPPLRQELFGFQNIVALRGATLHRLGLA